MARLTDITGKKFGRLTALRWTGELDKRRARVWLFLCECGTEIKRGRGHVVSGRSSSCGCIGRENLIKRNTTHGKSHLPEYSVWDGMFARVRGTAGKRAALRYKKRGITVCPRWKKFENFYEDMGRRPSEHHSLDRIDNDGDYGPENCRWATRRQQANNKSNNRVFLVDGKKLTLAELSLKSGIPYRTLYRRLQLGWPIEKATTTPIRGK